MRTKVNKHKIRRLQLSSELAHLIYTLCLSVHRGGSRQGAVLQLYPTFCGRSSSWDFKFLKKIRISPFPSPFPLPFLLLTPSLLSQGSSCPTPAGLYGLSLRQRQQRAGGFPFPAWSPLVTVDRQVPPASPGRDARRGNLPAHCHCPRLSAALMKPGWS